MTAQAMSATGNITEYVTTMIGGQLFGLPIARVQDVFMPERMTRVPLAGGDVAGVLNLRGESYGLLIDSIGEVLKLADDGREENPVNLDSRMAKISGGVHRLDGHLMVVLDVDRILEMSSEAMAA
jgi:purine-binding chemotaxis protein CheW